MSTENIAAPPHSGVDWRRAEFVLTVLGVLGVIAVPPGDISLMFLPR